MSLKKYNRTSYLVLNNIKLSYFFENINYIWICYIYNIKMKVLYSYILYMMICVSCVNYADSYNLNNFPILKKIFGNKVCDNYNKISYKKYNTNYLRDKVSLDKIAENIVGPRKNSTKIK